MLPVNNWTMASSMAPTDQARLVEFALRWQPYGGGSAEDIFVEFGLTEKVYFERLSDVLYAGAAVLTPAAHAALRAICTSRLRSL
jgi:hypothetical protein